MWSCFFLEHSVVCCVNSQCQQAPAGKKLHQEKVALNDWNHLKCGYGADQLDWTSIQSRGFGHGGWKQELDKHHPTKTEQLVRSCVEKQIPSVYSPRLRRQNGRVKNLWETEWYDDRLDEEQRRGVWTYKEKNLCQRRLASLEAWTCLKTQRTRQEAPIDTFVTCKPLIVTCKQ